MTHVVHFNRFFPFLLGGLRSIPLELVRKVQPYAALVIDLRNTLQRMASNSLNAHETKGSRMTIFGAMNKEEILAVERSIDRLTDEAQILIAAGTETTARVLVVLTYYLCLHPDVLLRLRKELAKLGTDQPNWTDLESVPYLVRATRCKTDRPD